MVCTPPAARPALDLLDAVDDKLHRLKHLAVFIAEITAVHPPTAQLNCLTVESITEVFTLFEHQIEAVRELATNIRRAI